MSAAHQTAIAKRAALIASLQSQVKYVFVLYQENRSFDSYFGTFPGANGIYSQPASATAGYSQPIENVDGTFSMISPFRIGPAQYAADTDDVDHSHYRLIPKMDVTVDGPQMDRFALVEEQKRFATGTLPSLQAKQYGELAMAHEDCDTIPLLWNYATRFTLMDNVFQYATGPSTPGNLAIIGAQMGETQYALHPSEGYTGNGGSGAGVPVTNDADPGFGPYNPGDGATAANVQYNLTYATLPFTLAGSAIKSVVASDPTSGIDFADTLDDVNYVAHAVSGANWGWFQEGYDQEPGEPSAAASLANYVTHHNGPQYFGYIANSSERRNLHGLGDFMKTLAAGKLPGAGVFYVKGGEHNIMGLKPTDPDPTVQANFTGDDDHPGYSDAQISEALVAETVDTIVRSKYWKNSAIIITYDDSEGDYDHVPPPLRSIGPGSGNLPADYLGDGPRVPTIVISPFAKDHYVDHSYGDQGSVVKFVDTVFGLTPLSSLPDEEKGRSAAEYVGKFNYGPDDGDSNGITDLLNAFDPDRLAGHKAPLSSNYAYVDQIYITNLPQALGLNCRTLGITPVDYTRGVDNHIPSDFNPRPGTNPTQANVKSIDTRKLVNDAKDLDD